MTEEPLSVLRYAVPGAAADDTGRVVADRLGVGLNEATALQHLLTSCPAGWSERVTSNAGRILRIDGATTEADRSGAHGGRTGPAPLLARLDAIEHALDDANRGTIARYLIAMPRGYHDCESDQPHPPMDTTCRARHVAN